MDSCSLTTYKDFPVQKKKKTKSPKPTTNPSFHLLLETNRIHLFLLPLGQNQNKKNSAPSLRNFSPSHPSTRGTSRPFPSILAAAPPRFASPRRAFPTMLAGVGRRVSRLACALAHRRHYLSVQIGGGDGIQPVGFKLLLPWEASRPKPYDTSTILRVMTPMEGNCGDKSRATIKMHENDEVIASLELSPVEIDMCDEDEEEQSQDTESSSEDEDDCFYPTNKDTSSDDEIMELFYHENTAESTFDTAESRDSVKYSHNRRPYSSIINLCLWPKELFASVAVFETDGKGNCTWQSFWRFNLEIDSIANENSHDATGPLVALSRYRDQRLQYTGVIRDPMLQKFKISLDTHYQVKDLLGSGAEGEVYRCVSLKNTHSCAVKWSAYDHTTNEDPERCRL